MRGQHGEKGERESWLLQLSRHGRQPGEENVRTNNAQDWKHDPEGCEKNRGCAFVSFSCWKKVEQTSAPTVSALTEPTFRHCSIMNNGLRAACCLQVFSYTADKEIRSDDLCLDVSRLNGPVVMLKCHHMKGNQMFEYDAEVRSEIAKSQTAVTAGERFIKKSRQGCQGDLSGGRTHVLPAGGAVCLSSHALFFHSMLASGNTTSR